MLYTVRVTPLTLLLTLGKNINVMINVQYCINRSTGPSSIPKHGLITNIYTCNYVHLFQVDQLEADGSSCPIKKFNLVFILCHFS